MSAHPFTSTQLLHDSLTRSNGEHHRPDRSSRAAPTAEEASYFESVLVGHDAVTQQLFISRELCGHSMPDLDRMQENPFWRTFTNLTLAKGEELHLHAYVDGPIIEVVANAKAVLSLSVWPAVNESAALGTFGGAALVQAGFYPLATNLRASDLPGGT